jgi:ABC-type amino acid transport substrate-binding protein
LVSPAPRPSNADPSLAAFDDVIAKGMAKDPDQRYQTGRALSAAVQQAMDAPRVRASRGRGARHSAPRSAAEHPTRRRALMIAALAALLVAVCVFAAWQLRGASGGGGQQAGSDTTATLGAVPSIAATVPTDVKSGGRLVIGVNLPYAPNEFRDNYGKLVGFDVDLMNAVARTLGLTPDYREVAFDAIIPAVQAGDFHVGMSSFTDTRAREQNVDFVDYFQAGSLWAQRSGPPIDPNHACGLRVGVAAGVIQETEEIPAKSQACVAAGLPPIDKVVFKRHDDIVDALIAGQVDAMSADSPVTGFDIKNSGGALEAAGEVFDAGPYGWPVAKGSALAESLRQALEHLMKTGEYRTIATLWGVEKGTIDKPSINAAIR